MERTTTGVVFYQPNVPTERKIQRRTFILTKRYYGTSDERFLAPDSSQRDDWLVEISKSWFYVPSERLVLMREFHRQFK